MAPPSKTKSARSDSAQAALKAMQNAALGDLRPPEHVQITASAEPYFVDIVRARARDEWNGLQLTVAAQLAQCFADQREVEAELAVEGRIITNNRGTKVLNPLVSCLEQMARKEMAFMRTLQMGGRVPGGEGDARNKAGARKAEANARSARKQVETEEDDLLAR